MSCYSRRYGTKCGGCGDGISPSELVRKAREIVFHLNCFTCLVCRKQLSTGEELYVLADNKFICKKDFLEGKAPTLHHGESLTFLLPFLMIINSQVLQFSGLFQSNVTKYFFVFKSSLCRYFSTWGSFIAKHLSSPLLQGVNK